MKTPPEEALFAAALERPAGERAAFLARACGGDDALRARVEALLAAHDATANPLATRADSIPTFPEEFTRAPDEGVGQVIGRYKLLEQLGEGGCGVVYVAEQTEPVRRRVALKVIKLGMDTKSVVARFEAERQALAMMDHPNIARVLDAGTTGQGRPYFVMELVRGIRITDFCNQNGLPVHERLQLVIRVCQAIQHAHQKGIIHRDIKPSNILVTLHDGVAVPKVIDFGIAKATEGRLTDATVYTQLHQFIGTPAYMSPEQAEMSGLDIDTRSDLYSLGVLLYELLTGVTPFDGRELVASGLDGMRRTIREREPVPPSTRLTQLLTAAAAPPVALRHPRFASDLDWIVMKCLEKDRTRRYETANGLAADLRRHLDNEPVVARPPSAGYRLGKAFRRYRLIFLAGGAVAAALVLGLIASAWQAVRATRAERAQSQLRSVAEQALGAEAQQRRQAEAATARESELRRASAVLERNARLQAYAADINLAHLSVERNDIGRAQELLDRYRPANGGDDLRGWEWRYLWKLCRSEAAFRLFHRDEGFWSLSASHDGLRVAAGLPYVFLDVTTRRPIEAPWKQERPRIAVFSPSEALVAAAFPGTNGTAVRLYDTTTGALRWSLTNLLTGLDRFPTELDRLQFSPDGGVLTTVGVRRSDSGWSHEIRLWRVADAQPLFVRETPLSVAVDFSTASALTRDRRLLVVTDSSAPTRVLGLDSETGARRWATDIKGRMQDNMILSIVLSPDSRWVVVSTGTGDGTLHILDARTGDVSGQLEGHLLYVKELLFLDEGRVLASASADRTIRLWDFRERKPLVVLHGHRNEVKGLATLGDGRMLVSAALDGEVLVWDWQARARRTSPVTLPRSARSWRFAPGDDAVISVGEQGEIIRSKGPELDREEILVGPGRGRDSVLLSDDGEHAVRIGADGGVFACEWKEPGQAPRRIGRVDPGDVRPLRLEHDSPRLFAERDIAGERQLEWWDLAAGRLIRSWPMGKDPSIHLFSPDGDRLLSVHEFGGVHHRFDVAAGDWEPLGTDRLPELRRVYCAALDPAGKVLAVATEPHVLRRWQLPEFREIGSLRGHMTGAKAVAFSPDGRRLATASGSFEALKLWDPESQLELITLGAGGSFYTRTLFSPDGRRIGIGNPGGLVHVWSAPSWEEIAAAEAREKAEDRP